MMIEEKKPLVKNQLKLLEIAAEFPEGILKRDLFLIYNNKKSVKEVKFEYSIKKFDLRKNANNNT